jgi:uncharacterized protein YebE (UPF0316 family)
MIIDILKVFSFAIIIDLMWVLYILASTEKRRIAAAFYSMCIGGPALFGTLEVVENVWLSIPYLLGLGIGSILGIELNERIKRRKSVKE